MWCTPGMRSATARSCSPPLGSSSPAGRYPGSTSSDRSVTPGAPSTTPRIRADPAQSRLHDPAARHRRPDTTNLRPLGTMQTSHSAGLPATAHRFPKLVITDEAHRLELRSTRNRPRRASGVRSRLSCPSTLKRWSWRPVSPVPRPPPMARSRPARPISGQSGRSLIRRSSRAKGHLHPCLPGSNPTGSDGPRQLGPLRPRR
jgi:hypothetical protein